MTEIFTEKASARLHTPQDFELPLTVISPPAWILLCMLTLAVLFGVYWSFFFYLPEYATAKGVLVDPTSIEACIARSNGIVTNLNVGVGQHVERGELVASIKATELQENVIKSEGIEFETIQRHQKTDGDEKALLEKKLANLDLQMRRIEASAAENKRLIADIQSNLSKIPQTMTSLKARKERARQYKKKTKDYLNQLVKVNEESKFDSPFKSDVDAPTFSKGELQTVRGQDQEADDAVTSVTLSTLNIDQEQLTLNSDLLDAEVRARDLARELDRIAEEQEDARVEYMNKVRLRGKELTRVQIDLESAKRIRDERSKIYSPTAGMIVNIEKRQHSAVKDGDRIAALIRGESKPEDARCIGYFEIGKGSKINLGDQALVTPTTHRRERHGSINGIVIGIDEYLSNQESEFSVLGHKELAQDLLKTSNLKKVTILLRDQFLDSIISIVEKHQGKKLSVFLDADQSSSIGLETESVKLSEFLTHLVELRQSVRKQLKSHSKATYQIRSIDLSKIIAQKEITNDEYERMSANYSWTSGKNPVDFEGIRPGTTASIRVQTDKLTPVDYAFELFRTWRGKSDIDLQ